MKFSVRNLIIMMLMIAASGMAVALKPTKKVAELAPKFDLQTLIPKSFGEWHEELASSSQIIDPRQKEMIDKAYSQTLTRTYVSHQGYRVMLSVAYGSDQSDAMQVHKPESCYPAQGFILENRISDVLPTKKGTIPIVRIETHAGARYEPVTYWTTIGEAPVKGRIHKKLVEMSYALTGKIPDGMLVRISSIDKETSSAYQMHDRFSKQMLEALAPEAQRRLAGNLEAQ